VILHGMVVGSLAVNCYIIGCEETREVAVIDPGGNPDEIVDFLKKENLKATHIINTHGHIDHIGGNKGVKDATGAKLLIHENDAAMLENPRSSFSFLIGNQMAGTTADQLLKDGDIIQIGNEVKLEVIHTPGHTTGGICLKTGDIIFVGDTLFQGSIGRTDLPGGSYSQLISSIKDRLMCFEDHVNCFPGHGPATTIGFERKHNPFIR